MKAKNVEIFTWREIKNTVEVYLESWLIARVGEEEWTILEEEVRRIGI